MSPEMTRFKKLTLVVGVPSTIQWFQKFASCYMNMTTYFNNHRVEQYKEQRLHAHTTVGSILPKSRMEILRGAKELDADFLLWLDSDHTFPKSMIHRMIHGMLVNNYDVLAANCVTKTMPCKPTARNKPVAGSTEWRKVYTDPTSPEYEKVDRIGTGVMMLSRRAIQALPLSCFPMFWRDDVQDYQGEDWSMVDELDKLGFEIWIDHPLSAHVGHLGIFEFTHQYVGETVVEPIGEPDAEQEETPRVVLAHA